MGRFDGDADVDVWLWSGDESINPNSEVKFANGTGGWSSNPRQHFPASLGPHVHPGDFDGNGRTDLFLYTGLPAAPWNARVSFSNGGGGWNTVDGAGLEPSMLAYPGDYNGDGKTDIFLYSTTGATGRVYRANGSGGWNPGPVLNFGTPGYLIYPGYFDDDKYEDILLLLDAGLNATYRIRFGKSDGTFLTKSDPGAGTLPGDRDEYVAYLDGSNGTDPTQIAKLKRADVLFYGFESGLWDVRFSDGNGLLTGTENGSWGSGEQVAMSFENGDSLTDVIRYNGTRIQVLFRGIFGGWTGGVQEQPGGGFSLWAGYFDKT